MRVKETQSETKRQRVRVKETQSESQRGRE